MAGRSWYLICYDICLPKRLSRVHRLLKNQGIPVQYSVFLVDLRPSQMNILTHQLYNIIESTQDDIRIYPLPKKAKYQQYGKEFLSETIRLLCPNLPEPK